MKAYDKATSLRGRAESEAIELLKRAASDPRAWTRHYNHVRGLDQTVIEIDLSGGARMLAYAETKGSQVTLLTMGKHDIVNHYVRLDTVKADPETVVRGQGLNNIEQRAQGLGGDFKVKARTPRGSLQVLSFPAVEVQR